MHAPRRAGTTLRRIVTNTVAAGALVGCGAVGGTAHASTGYHLPDLVAAGPTDVVSHANGTLFYARVRNHVTDRSAFARASTATIKFQPVSRLILPGGPYYINTPGSTAITAIGSVGPLAPAGEERFHAHADRTPSGLNRITVCADSSSVLSELSELNNCSSEVKDVVPLVLA